MSDRTHSSSLWISSDTPCTSCRSYPPFHEENHVVLYRKIKAADYTFDDEYWGMVSDEAKDLIRKARAGAEGGSLHSLTFL